MDYIFGLIAISLLSLSHKTLVTDHAFNICGCLYGGGPALLGGISVLTIEISPRRAGNFPYKRNLRGLTLLGGLASQSSVHMTKFVLASIF